jgi:[ribosomal protein S18]-alanine N-acetyltransferase
VERSGGKLNIRPIDPRDAEAILGIQAESPEIAQWSKNAYERLAEENMAGWTAEANGEIGGFITARRIADDIEILNFAVRKDTRRQGAGALLLNEVLAWAKNIHAEKIYLEVRASNLPARTFYESHGFRETGRRPRYYSAPVEDALLLALALSSEPPRG